MCTEPALLIDWEIYTYTSVEEVGPDVVGAGILIEDKGTSISCIVTSLVSARLLIVPRKLQTFRYVSKHWVVSHDRHDGF